MKKLYLIALFTLLLCFSSCANNSAELYKDKINVDFNDGEKYDYEYKFFNNLSLSPNQETLIFKTYQDLAKFLGELNSKVSIPYLKQYTDDFFKNRNLILVGITSGSGSVRYDVDSIVVENGILKININEFIPILMTWDMDFWDLFVSIDKKDFNGDTVIVECSGNGKLVLSDYEFTRFLSPLHFNQTQESYVFKTSQELAFFLEEFDFGTKISYFNDYTDSFFETKNLILVGITSGSGSVTYTLDGVGIIDNIAIINIEEYVPQYLTADMAYWNLFITIDKSSFNGEEIIVNVDSLFI